jgi:hypothetical protein
MKRGSAPQTELSESPTINDNLESSENIDIFDDIDNGRVSFDGREIGGELFTKKEESAAAESDTTDSRSSRGKSISSPVPVVAATAASTFLDADDDDGDDDDLFGRNNINKKAPPVKALSLFKDDDDDDNDGDYDFMKKETKEVGEKVEIKSLFTAKSMARDNEEAIEALSVLKNYLLNEGAGAPKAVWTAMEKLEELSKAKAKANGVE